MKAVRVHQEGGSTHLKVEDVPKPSAGPGELLVQIKASFVQPADILNSKGQFKSTTFPRILGKDFAGVVVEGPDEWKGKKVFGTSGPAFSFTEDGAQCEFAVLKGDAVAVMPQNISFAQAASLGTPWTTAMTTLLRTRTKPTDVVMVLGATGSVGSAAVQMAKAMGCRVITVGRHGVDINSEEDTQLSKAKALTDGKGVDVVVDTVGNFDLINAALAVLAPRGRLSVISAPRQGSTQIPIDLLAFYRGQKELVGCNTVSESQSDMAAMLRDMVPELESGKLVPPAEKTLNLIPVDQAEDAYSGKVKRAVITFD